PEPVDDLHLSKRCLAEYDLMELEVVVRMPDECDVFVAYFGERAPRNHEHGLLVSLFSREYTGGTEEPEPKEIVSIHKGDSSRYGARDGIDLAAQINDPSIESLVRVCIELDFCLGPNLEAAEVFLEDTTKEPDLREICDRRDWLL